MKDEYTRFYTEGFQAFQAGKSRECQYSEETIEKRRWVHGWDAAQSDRICPDCGQNHRKVAQCIRAKGGRTGKKDPEKQWAKAIKRWEAWRESREKVEKLVI